MINSDDGTSSDSGSDGDGDAAEPVRDDSDPSDDSDVVPVRVVPPIAAATQRTTATNSIKREPIPPSSIGKPKRQRMQAGPTPLQNELDVHLLETVKSIQTSKKPNPAPSVSVDPFGERGKPDTGTPFTKGEEQGQTRHHGLIGQR
eukprot:scpid93011/ scgid17672/ 